MCELYIRTVERVNAEDKYATPKLTQRGDVIVIREDGWKWGSGETDSAEHIIVPIPGVPAGKLTAFLVPEIGDPMVNKMLQRRGFGFDLDAYFAALKADSKALTEGVALALKFVRPPIPDPNVIG